MLRQESQTIPLKAKASLMYNIRAVSKYLCNVCMYDTHNALLTMKMWVLHCYSALIEQYFILDTGQLQTVKPFVTCLLF